MRQMNVLKKSSLAGFYGVSERLDEVEFPPPVLIPPPSATGNDFNPAGDSNSPARRNSEGGEIIRDGTRVFD